MFVLIMIKCNFKNLSNLINFLLREDSIIVIWVCNSKLYCLVIIRYVVLVYVYNEVKMS